MARPWGGSETRKRVRWVALELTLTAGTRTAASYGYHTPCAATRRVIPTGSRLIHLSQGRMCWHDPHISNKEMVAKKVIDNLARC